ncbi:protein kinase domain-containing protein [Colletotrichum orchidophilum]|uniref:Protein kinase domain-containing protein n=1 Tax=Colletotrichum orchidophilum TaxID=1209926 RepID=A0A1G4AUY5_9PEZI|nr:protein kinase domain-containing protein [Colletotrichum orchidophilum]OHE92906.1 protein kinase domain-containing protein [Colletotrichum orchidophilum]
MAKPLTLHRRLTDVQEQDDLNGKRNYLPLDALHAIINENNLFVILVHLGVPWDIKKLMDARVTDDHLPLFKNKRGKYGEQLQSACNASVVFDPPDEWEEQVVDGFIEKQWLVQAPVFETAGAHRILDALCPLPITKMDTDIHSQRSVVYKTTVHRHHQQGFLPESPNLRVALKEFKYRGDFQQERENLAKIRKLRNKHITLNFETFSQSDRSYIVFPWAEGGDLENFWHSRDDKPRTPQLALWSLEQMLGLSGALHALHEQIGEEANCRHGDLKPANILHFLTGSGEGTLKISDFGISRIHQDATFERQEKPTITRATSPSYEAPEAIMWTKQARSRKYDIWSLGCILLEFTIWLVQDWKAVEKFNNARRLKVPQPGGKTWAHFYQIEGTAVFVHPEVTRTMTHLGRTKQAAPGTALGDLLDVIQKSLVRIEVKERLDAKSLYEKLQQITSKARYNSTYLFGLP